MIVVIGGGLAGCTAALEIAKSGIKVLILEKTSMLGGKVINYGCKATERCNNCGLCLTAGLWDNVKENELIDISYDTQIIDVSGSKGQFNVICRTQEGIKEINDIEKIIIAAGFEAFSDKSLSGSIEMITDKRIITGSYLEKVIAHRRKNVLWDDTDTLKSIAFIQCFGSRDIKEKAPYCSRVCCGYSTRAAKVFKYYYPDIKITFFYMDIQRVQGDNYFESLLNEGMRFIRSRPVNIKKGNPPAVVYEEPGKEGVKEEKFDLIVLTEGIHPASDTEQLAEICMLGINENGFLEYVQDPEITGIYLAGCIGGPLGIEETYTEAVTVAGKALSDMKAYA
jgi:heterodisulfide reductase subunit A2